MSLSIEPLGLAAYTQQGIFEPIDKDPINLLYAGALADLREVLRITDQVLGCTTTWGIGDQVFAEPSLPTIRHRQDFNRADSMLSGLFGRVHTRIYQVFSEHDRLGRLVASPIHKDRWAWCAYRPSDVAASFDEARDWAVQLLRAAGFEAVLFPLAAIVPVTQCDGSVVTTDGWLAVVADPGFFVTRGLQRDD